MNFQLQTAALQDETFLAELFFEVRAPEFASLPAAMVGPLLEMQHRAQLRAYAEKFPAAINQIVWIDGQRAGRLLVSTTPEEIHLVDVALLGRFRGQGVGTQLMGDLCRKARAENLPLRLSVQAGNPAWRLYERLGFAPTGGDGVYIAMELGAATAVAPPPSEAVMPGPTAKAEPGLNQAYFQSLRGKTVEVRTLGGVHTALKVVDVQPLRAERGPVVDLGDSFRVEFSGPVEPIVPPETVEMAAEGEAAQLLFLSPLGPLDGVMQYEAIFNRTRLPDESV